MDSKTVSEETAQPPLMKFLSGTACLPTQGTCTAEELLCHHLCLNRKRGIFDVKFSFSEQFIAGLGHAQSSGKPWLVGNSVSSQNHGMVWAGKAL